MFICGCTENVELGYGVRRCINCTHGYREYIPNEILKKYYDKKYWKDDKNRQGILEVKEGKEWSQWLNGRICELERFGLLNDKIHKVLEFGC
ncbi:MAG: hypothetical protein MJ133_03830 [Lachnospiraceae bacterium]|nr:hypothetical protein [Lachnospiraceae bacterium]